MDDDEEEDHVYVIRKRTLPVTLVIVKSCNTSTSVKQPYRHRIVPYRQPRLVDKISLLLLALLFSDSRSWFACAQNINQFNVSRFRTLASLEDYHHISNPSSASLSDRRLRHDTIKGAASKRLIPFEMVSNTVPDVKDDDTADNTSTQYLRDEGFRSELSNRHLLEVTTTERTSDDITKQSIINSSAEKLVSPKDNGSCSCFGGKRKVSKAFHGLTISLRHSVLNTSEGITAGLVYRVIIGPTKKIRTAFLSTESAKGVPVGFFLPSHKSCSNAVQFFSHKFNDSQISLNWSLPTTSRNLVLSNVIFRLCYQLVEYNHSTTYEVINEFPVLKGCEFRLRSQRGSISSSELIPISPGELLNCSVIFSNVQNTANKSSRPQGLIVKLTRLNIQCNLGNVSFSFNGSVLLCGKLEEILPSDREFYFPSSQYRPRLLLLGRPVFAVSYELVDFCYNMTLTAPNDSVIINPLLKIFCNYKISLPYGYRVNVSFSIKSNALPKFSKFKDLIVNRSNGTTAGDKKEVFRPIEVTAPDDSCPGIVLRYWNGDNSYIFCEHEVAAHFNYRFQLLAEENQLCFRVSSQNESRAAFYMRYEAVEIEDIVGSCGFGSIMINSYCVNVIDDKRLDWTKAEEICTQQGGHLASILDEPSQHSINKFLLKSPGYQDHNSYWIGASDIGHEGEFRWADSSSFSYTNWFTGWSLNGYYNRQPNDDGFSSQDCVELRRQYHVSPAGISTNGSKVRLTQSFTWNDRDCQTRNYFLCEFLKIPSNGKNQFQSAKQECNQKLSLTQENDRTVIASPEFPRNYPHNKNCLLQLDAPPSYKIVIGFEEFVLENEPNCSYDYLEVYENTTVNGTNGSNSENGRRFCGDWSDKLKLLRYISTGPRLFLRFVSDYSHSFSGYKAHISIEQVKTECPDNRQQPFNGSCYLFVSYPQVTWQTAQDICSGVQGNLASVYNLEEEQFVVAKIRESHEYTTSTIYWLGGKYNIYDEWKWTDNTSIIFNAWVPMRTNLKNVNNYDTCLGIQWIPSPSSLLPSGLYWVPISCQKIGGYVCKMRNEASAMKTNLNFTVNGTEGELISSNFPGNYYHNLDYWMRIIGPENTRIIIQFHTFDLEDQKNCLYDYLEVYNATVDSVGEPSESVKHCGHHHTNSLHRLNYVSSKNEATLRFHSDYSVSGSGFSATWRAVDISGCPIQTLTAKEGIVTSPNYPNFLLANLQCTTTILAPVGREVWFELLDLDFNNKRQSLEENTISESDLYLLLSDKGKLYPYQDSNVLTDGVYLSYGEYMRIRLRTGDAPNGSGFKGLYKTISDLTPEPRVINLRNDSNGNVFHLNFPLKPVPGLNFMQRFVAPLGFSIQMLFHQVVPSSLGVRGEPVCRDEDEKGFIEVRDHYADRNGTWWQFCDVGHQDAALNQLAITSYLNTITVKQISHSRKVGVGLNATLSVIPDPNFKTKIVQFPQNYMVESCVPNPCHNSGKCVSDELHKRCECINHFTGLFCALTICDINPCVFGACVLTPDYFKCVCQSGYQGKLCDSKMKPCSNNPCEGRGECIEKSNFTYVCQCHAWWEGERCDKKIANIPYKPLTDRMLEEPFWLGLLTVFVVLSILGLVWCARRHFPEKLEKLLAEEAERNRHYTSTGRVATARAEMAAQNGIATAVNVSQTNTANSSPNPRTLLRRLGIRKPSLFSLTSPLQPTHTARTFSLDDLFKPSSSRSHVYKPRAGGTSHRKKSTDKLLKKQSMSVDENTLKQGKKVEIVELKENTIGPATGRGNYADKTSSATESATVVEETSFIFPKLDKKSDKRLELNYKNEKKVHFARLMSKMQAEIISSQSDVDVGLLKEEDNEPAWSRKLSVEKPLAASAQTLLYELKSPHSTSSNQGSDSLSGSEMTLITASGEKRRPSLLTLGTNGRYQKAASADSILAMFRKFSLSTGPPSESNSNFVSSSTSPTASSPPDEIAGSDISSALSLYHPGSVNESPPYTNKLQPSTVQVSVLDPLNSQTTTSIASSNLLHPPTILLEVPNKCLSPIHEVPTPSPSPLMTPILPRHCPSSANSNNTNEGDNNNAFTSISQCSNENVMHSGSSERSGGAGSSSFTQTSSSTSSSSSSSSSSSKPSTKGTSEVSFAHSSTSSSSSSSSKLHQLTSLTSSALAGKVDGTSISEYGRKSNLLPVPKFVIHEASPTDEVPAIVLCPGTPPPDTPSTFLCLRAEHRPSLELSTPPRITVTHTSEVDSDPDCPTKCSGGASSATVYLSPFAGCSRTDRTASESNLSSSGYSSMTSPGPSRCGSSNPLCPSEGEDQHSPRRSLHLGRPPSYPPEQTAGQNAIPPSDSETLSDDHQMESNDESFATDQIVQKIEHGDVKSAKELKMFIENEQIKRSAERNDGLDLTFDVFAAVPMSTRVKVTPLTCTDQSVDGAKLLSSNSRQSANVEIFAKLEVRKSSLQPPSTVLEVESGGALIENRSPVSSRSESPLSDRAVGFERFSPMFYGRMTDSDGVYDWTSSECTKPIHRKHFGRRREKHRCKSPNTKAKIQLDVPSSSSSGKPVVGEKCRKPSPKRRARSQLIKASSSSSSSSESTGSRSKICLRRLHSPHKGRYLSKSSLCSTTDEVSGDDSTFKNLCSSESRRTSLEELREEDQMGRNHKILKNQRFSIIGKLSSILSHEKKPKWNTDEEYSASVPLLVQRHSDENQDNVAPVKPSQAYVFQNSSTDKHGQHSSSGYGNQAD